MPVQLTCPSCQRQLRVPDNLVGKMVKCPGCQTAFTAEVEGTGGAAPPPPPRSEERYRDDEPPARSSRRDRDEGYRDEPPARSSRRSRDDDDFDDDFDDDRGPRRRRRRGGNYAPHRGGMILAFGILGFFVCIIFGIMAWVMGNNDLKEIRAGRMDPEGESMTNIGRILGMISCILGALAIAAYCLIVIVALAAGK